MKVILKMIDSKWDLDYGETFNSKKKVKTRHSLILELRKAIALNFCSSVNQLSNWLKSLHKSQQSKNKIKQSGRIVANKRRVHNNSRIQDVSI